MQRVTRENQAMQERLKQVEPQYNHLKWLEDWYKSEKYENNIARYPRAWYTAQRLQVTPSVLKKHRHCSQLPCQHQACRNVTHWSLPSIST